VSNLIESIIKHFFESLVTKTIILNQYYRIIISIIGLLNSASEPFEVIKYSLKTSMDGAYAYFFLCLEFWALYNCDHVEENVEFQEGRKCRVSRRAKMLNSKKIYL
jgi:hypothetical protein